MEPPLERGTNVCINSPGHMTKIAAIPIRYGINVENHYQNQKSYDLETWHAALGTLGVQSIYK